jgi:diguanylate cyclase (GGDEF)-like protein/PAS domain S-box-containing protein
MNRPLKKNNKFRTICESIQDGVFMINERGNTVFWNKTAERLFGYKKKEVMGKDISKLLLHQDLRKGFNKEFIRLKKKGKIKHTRKSLELDTLRGLRKDGTEFPLELSLSLVNINGTYYIIGTARDITKRKNSEEAVVHEWQVEKTISDISSRFIGIFNIDRSINLSLEDIGNLSGASRAYLFLFTENGLFMNNTHEWCNKGVSPEKNNLQNLPTREFPWWMDKLKNKKIIHIKDVSKMPLEAKNEKKILEDQKIKSLLVFPLLVDGKIAGFMGFDNIHGIGKWSDENFSLLRLFSEIVGNALKRKRADKALKQKTHEIRERVKELNCLYKISNLCEKELSLQEIYQKTVDLIPTALEFPDIACARITINSIHYKTENFKETDCKQTASIIVNGTFIGNLEVFYKQKREESKDGCFTEEENNLIDAIAKRLSRMTEYKQAVQALHQSEKKYRMVVEKANGIPYVVDNKGFFKYIGQQVEKYGFKTKDIEGSNFLKLIYPADRELTIKDFQDTITDGTEMVTVFRVETPEMGIRYIEDSGRILKDSRGNNIGITGILMDITDHKQAEEKLKRKAKEAHFLSLIDDLTGLYNRRGFLTLAKQQLRIAGRTKKNLLAIYADIDQLKQINDSFGHRVGSLALIETANILKETFRSSDIIARIGGDEFVVLAIETSKSGEKSIASRFQQNLDLHNSKRNRPYNYSLSISIGISRYNPKDPCSLDELVDRADRLMYKEKRRKKEKVKG